MLKQEIKQSYSLYNVIAVALAVSLYVVGRFGFTDILGLKRLLEILIFFPVGIMGVLIVFQNPTTIINNPFFLLPVSFFIVQFYWLPDGLALADLSCAALITGMILSLGPNFSDRLLRYVIHIACFFAFLGIIEFQLLLLQPDLKANILLFYDDYSGSSVPVIDHIMQMLGLADGTTYHLWGMTITRLRSFASEPSLLVGYFLVPGALALTYGGRYITYGFVCITFCVCSLAGSVFAALALTMCSIGLWILRSRTLFLITPFILLVMFIWVLNNHFTDLLVMTKTSNGGYDFLDKTHSANMRFSYIRDMWATALSAPLGLSHEINQPLGLVICAAARGGYVGLILMVMVLLKLFGRIGSLLLIRNLSFYKKVGLLIVYGSLLTGVLYLDNCFIQIFGFTLLILIYNRLETLVMQAKS